MPRYFIFNFVYVCGYMHVSAGAQGAQQYEVPLELVLQVAVTCSTSNQTQLLWTNKVFLTMEPSPVLLS